MMPRSTYRSCPPLMVNVLPEPVWPYANTVPLNPSKDPSTDLLATRSNTSSCFASGPMMPSKPNWYFSRWLLTYPPVSCLGTSHMTLLSFCIASGGERNGVRWAERERDGERVVVSFTTSGRALTVGRSHLVERHEGRRPHVRPDAKVYLHVPGGRRIFLIRHGERPLARLPAPMPTDRNRQPTQLQRQK